MKSIVLDEARFVTTEDQPSSFQIPSARPLFREKPLRPVADDGRHGFCKSAKSMDTQKGGRKERERGQERKRVPGQSRLFVNCLLTYDLADGAHGVARKLRIQYPGTVYTRKGVTRLTPACEHEKTVSVPSSLIRNRRGVEPRPGGARVS